MTVADIDRSHDGEAVGMLHAAANGNLRSDHLPVTIGHAFAGDAPQVVKKWCEALAPPPTALGFTPLSHHFASDVQ
jgi:hypothetical protein